MMNLPPPRSLPGSSSSSSVPGVGGTITTAAPIGSSGSTSSPSTAAQPQQFNEGLALFITFAILFILSTQAATAKLAMWLGIALLAIVWANAFSSGQAKTFWQALSS